MIKNRKKYFEENGVRELDLEVLITKELNTLYLQRGSREYLFLRTAIIWTIYDPDSLKTFNKNMLPNLKKEHNSKSSTKAIEYAIRSGVEEVCKHTPKNVLEKIFGCVFAYNGEVTPTEFIGGMADYVYLKIRIKIEGINIPLEWFL